MDILLLGFRCLLLILGTELTGRSASAGWWVAERTRGRLGEKAESGTVLLFRVAGVSPQFDYFLPSTTLGCVFAPFCSRALRWVVKLLV